MRGSIGVRSGTARCNRCHGAESAGPRQPVHLAWREQYGYMGSMEFDDARFCIRLVEDMSDAVVYSDNAGIIRFWNHGAERIFGYSVREALGRPLDIIIPEKLRQRHWAGYAETMRTGQTRYSANDMLAVPAMRKDGSRISVEFSILPFYDHAGRVIGIAAVLRDVTIRYEETKRLKAEISALKKASGASQQSE